MTRIVLTIGNKNLSSWSLRPWLLLREAGIDFEEHEMLFEQEAWRQDILSHSPSGRVPAARHGENVLWESLAIAEHIAELFPEKKLWPDAPTARAFARCVASEMHAGFAAMRKELSMDVVARFKRPVLSSEAQRDVARVQAIWEECRTRFGACGPFLFGHFSIADAMFAPVVFRFRSYDIPIATDAARAWSAHMLSIASMKAWERNAEEEVKRSPKPVADRGPAVSSAQHPFGYYEAQHCYAVIFANQLRAQAEGYEATAKRMVELAEKQPGFLGVESARGADGFGSPFRIGIRRKRSRAGEPRRSIARRRLGDGHRSTSDTSFGLRS